MVLLLVGLYLFGGEGPWDFFVYLFGGIAIFFLLFIDFCIQVLWGAQKGQREYKISKDIK
tara:strand:- start:1310 stop:1489 length:180 start_codon:yes stop_codon:yes gene_type:complete